MLLSKRKTRPGAKTRASLLRVEDGIAQPKRDDLVTEEPLEIRLEVEGRRSKVEGQRQTVAVTMRTPGHDFELAAGFLFAEGVIRGREEIRRIAYCTDEGELQQYNIVNLELRFPILPDLSPLDRHFFTNSACGVCGKSGLENLRLRGDKPLEPGFTVPAGIVSSLPDTLRRHQSLFANTGGLHAAALFDKQGKLLASREDVGRHNALDKLIGWALLEGKLPLSECIVLVSGRASYELAQKTLAAGIPILAAISAPSSLAVDVAKEFNLTLIGFLRGSFNLYSAPERVLLG